MCLSSLKQKLTLCMLFHLFLWPVCTNCLSHIFEEFEQLATPSLDGLDAAVHAVHCSFAPHPAPILLVSCEICFSIDIIDSSSISLDFYLAKKKNMSGGLQIECFQESIERRDLTNSCKFTGLCNHAISLEPLRGSGKFRTIQDSSTKLCICVA